MSKKGKITAMSLSLSMTASIIAGVTNVGALCPDDVLNENVDELQQSIIDYIFIKNYISENITLGSEMKKKLDFNNDGSVNVIDLSHVKNKILDLSEKQSTTPVTTTTVSQTTPVTTTTVSQTTSVTTSSVPTELHKGDRVWYSGKAYFKADGTGNTVDVSGYYTISDIIYNTQLPYTVQLENTGWVAYSNVVKRSEVTTSVSSTAVTTTVTSPPAGTSTTTPVTVTGDIKKGDYVKYEGDAHFTASGSGSTVKVSGIFKIAEILINSMYPYTVQLENTGWVSYKDVTGKDQPVTAADKFDGNVYRIKNAASKKYLTAMGADDRCNICQLSENGSSSQMFKTGSYYNTSSYRIYACCTDKTKVIDIVKEKETSVAEGCNVQIYDAVDPEAQTWIIEDAGNGKYKIVSAKDTGLALTAYGTSDGTPSGKTSSSKGNIYVSKYTGSESQLWYLEQIN